MEELQKESSFHSYHFYSSIWGAEIGGQVHVEVRVPQWTRTIALVVVKDGMVVRLLSQTESRILAEQDLLSMGIILELISSLQNIYLINFHSFIDPEIIHH